MTISKRVILGMLSVIFSLSLLATLGAVPSNASERSDDIDHEAVVELREVLKEMGYQGDLSEEVLRREFDSSPGAQSYGRVEEGVSARTAVNGCSTPRVAKVLTKKWDRIFKPACNNHDRCYSKNSKKSRLKCDNEFRTQMYGICAFRKDHSACKRAKDVYYYAVRAFGKKYYKGKGSSK